MDDTGFDRFARMMVAAMSRRNVIRLLGGGLALGGVAASHRRSTGGDRCAAFCDDLPLGPQRAGCRRDCARDGQGLFAACGGDPVYLCLAGDGTASCCPLCQACADGACRPVPAGFPCGPGRACEDGVCVG